MNEAMTQNMSQETIIMLIIAAIVGLAIGLIIGRVTAGNSKESPAAKKAISELSNYKKEVSEHFGKTADLVDNLTNSYKDVFEHLGSSAKTLLTKEEMTKHLESRVSKSITLSYIADKVVNNSKDTLDNDIIEETNNTEIEDKIETNDSNIEKQTIDDNTEITKDDSEEPIKIDKIKEKNTEIDEIDEIDEILKKDDEVMQQKEAKMRSEGENILQKIADKTEEISNKNKK